MNKKQPDKPRRPRNLLACHPLLQKGGAHKQSKKAERRAAKLAIKREYLGENLFSELAFAKVFRMTCMLTHI